MIELNQTMKTVLFIVRSFIIMLSMLSIIGYGYKKDLINVIAWGVIFLGFVLGGK